MVKVLKRITTVIITVVIFFFFLSFSIKSVLAENLLIVEVQIAGEKINDDNDFIKIHNHSDYDLDISGYKLRKRTSTGKESSIRVFPNGSKIPAKGYFLWANSKNDFHLTIGADIWNKAYLAKNNSIALLSPEGIILDALAWGESQNPFVLGSPFPENPGPNQRLKRKQINGIYQDTNNNSQDFYLYPPSEPETKTLLQKEPQPKPQLESQSESLIYPSGIFINEILAYTPLGTKDEEGEYIELFNQNNFEIDLSNWKIKDTTGRTTTYVFPQGTKIVARGFLVLYRPTTMITLNNERDGLNLIQPNGKIRDSVSYEKAPRGQSYNRTPSGWVWSTNLTPGRENIISAHPVKNEISNGAQKTEEAEAIKKIEKVDINTASLEELYKITGIGPALAQKIIEARPFYSLDELTKVSGIGQKTLEEIKKQALAWVDPELEQPKIEKTELAEKGLAAAAELFKQGSLDREIPKSLSIFLIALIIAFFSGIIILVLKRKIKTGQSL
ncbi:MAG: lamin tail domain-containing protein [Patescibacteria group bacterium]|nr:lamin tail domain-containing protein [Patescibacteria group bacterium]